MSCLRKPYTCSRCGKAGHNRLRCLDAPPGERLPKNRPRLCSFCGKPKPEARRGCHTCGPACEQAARQRAIDASRQTVTKPCEACGKAMRGSPSHIKNRRTCSPECRSRLPKAVRARSCSVCGKAHQSRSRSTCSDECVAEALRLQVEKTSQVGARSESYRRARRAEYRRKYRGKDKAQVVSRLTREQGGACACCGEHADLVLDHCHRTQQPRAMLCRLCNAALGMMKEDPERCLMLAKYAEFCRDKRDKCTAA